MTELLLLLLLLLILLLLSLLLSLFDDDDDVVVAVVMAVRYAIQVFLARAIVGAQSPGSAGNVWPTPARLRGR